MTEIRLAFLVLPEPAAVCRLEAGAKIPAWACRGDFFSITGTADELSVVCCERFVPAGAKRESGWRILKVRGPLDFSLTGILAEVSQTLADAGVALFAVSTYETDYILVKEQSLPQAVSALRAAGHHV